MYAARLNAFRDGRKNIPNKIEAGAQVGEKEEKERR